MNLEDHYESNYSQQRRTFFLEKCGILSARNLLTQNGNSPSTANPVNGETLDGINLTW